MASSSGHVVMNNNVHSLQLQRKPHLRSGHAQPFVRTAASRPRAETRTKTLAALYAQADRVVATRNWSTADDLSILVDLTRCAPPRARSVSWKGIRFPLINSLFSRIVLCPDTRRQLVSVVC